MHKLDQKGSLLIPLIISVTLLLGSLAFGVWAFMGRQDYKNNVEQKIGEAIATAEENLAIEKDAEFAEQYKLPNLTYTGPSFLGTLKFDYPKTWSAYINDTGAGTEPLNGFMHPVFVPAVNDKVNIALRFQVVDRTYEDELKTHQGNIAMGNTSMTPYRLPKVDSVLGARLNGQLAQKQGDMILLPLRDKTLKVWTEGSDYQSDFNRLLETLTFIP